METHILVWTWIHINNSFFYYDCGEVGKDTHKGNTISFWAPESNVISERRHMKMEGVCKYLKTGYSKFGENY